MSDGVCWCLMISDGSRQCVLVSDGMCWYLAESDAMCWCVTVSVSKELEWDMQYYVWGRAVIMDISVEASWTPCSSGLCHSIFPCKEVGDVRFDEQLQMGGFVAAEHGADLVEGVRFV